MTRSAVESQRRQARRIRRLVCGVAAVIAVLVGVPVVASGQITTDPAPAPNPDLRAECGLKVMLVLDESASIVSPGGGLGNQTSVVRSAANGFVDALIGTGSELATASFWNIGRPGRPYARVTTETANDFHAWVNGTLGPNPYNPTTGTTATNWEDGLNQVTRSGGPPDLVVFVTDGDPNTYNTGPGGSNSSVSTGTGTAQVQTALNRGVAAANRVKADGTGPHIFAIGVGPAVTNTASKERLTKISGTTVFPATAGTAQFPGTDELTHADFTVVGFSELRDKLEGIVSELCAGQLIITKNVLDHDGRTVEAGSGWEFRTTLSPPGGHTWVRPMAAGNDSTASLHTDENGQAHFAWTLAAGRHEVTVSVEHPERPNHTFVVAECRTVHPAPAGPTIDPPSENGIPSATIGREDFRTCTVTDRQHAANLTVVKHLEPADDPGRFDLKINDEVKTENAGDQQGTGPVTLPLGTHTVGETEGTQADGTPTSLADYDTSIRCVDVNNHDHVVVPATPGSGPVSVHLTSQDQNVVCTITNISTKFGDLTVIKHLVPENDPGRFDLRVNGDIRAPSVGDGGTTHPIRLPFGAHAVTETGAGGTDLARYDISTTCVDQDGRTVAHNADGPDVSPVLSRQSHDIQCTITNERPGAKVARLKVIKHLVPHDDAGRFDLLVGGEAFALGVGHNGTTGPLDFELGRHRVTEHAAGLTRLVDFSTSTTCVDRAHGGRTVAHNAHGPAVTVDLSRESDNIVCTITNRRTAAPGGNGEVPAPPGAAPSLAVTKTKPAHARVGSLVPITIVVHNFGNGKAHGVQLRENPPRGLRIVHAASNGTIRRNGTAVWRLGNLAHGASRTVHATARVLRPGRHVDTAAATARNADPALSVAALRATAAARHPRPRPRPPRVTG